MKTTKMVLAMMAMFLPAPAVRAADSVPFLLDTVEGTRIATEDEAIPLAYSPRWGGAANCSITADGAKVLSNAIDEGTLFWTPRGRGRHALAFEAGDLAYAAAFTVLGDDVVLHGGVLAADETWRADKTHLVPAPLTVPSGVTLTIGAGAVVKFMDGTSLTVASGGACVARGVVFTHVADDTIGGDTMMDGDATAPKVAAYKMAGIFDDSEDTQYRYRDLTVNVQAVTARQRYPWNGLIDIDCIVSCNDPSTNVYLYVTAEHAASGESFPVHSVCVENGALSDGLWVKTRDLSDGKVRLVWDAGADISGTVSDTARIEVHALVGGQSDLETRLSSAPRSIVFRYEEGHRGSYGFNGGSYSDYVFDGNFENYLYQNIPGTEIVIPTTRLDEEGHDTGVPCYVTDFSVGHAGNTKYSLFYTTENEPEDILSHSHDPRAWIPIDEAQGVQKKGTATFAVNQFATAVKYVFDTTLSWNQSLAELEVWGMESSTASQYSVASSELFRLDVRNEARVAIIGEAETITYSPRWNGAEDCSVTVDGAVILANAIDEGSLSWSASTSGLHILSHMANGETLKSVFTVLDEDVSVHGGTLTSSQTWSAAKVYLVTAPLTVPSGVTLTIEPGAVVKFMEGASLTVASGGACIARGVIFTHVADDTAGGDTMMDGDGTDGSPGTARPTMGAYSITGAVTDDDATEYRYMPPQTLSTSISSDTRLRGHRCYIVSNSVTVASGATLTLQPGTVLKFNTGCQMTVNGTLDAQGTRAAPIVFTSLKDDDHGGDTNGDGDKTRPDDGDWDELRNSGGTMRLVHAKVLYGGYGQYSNQGDAAVRTSGGTTTLDCCEVAHSNMRLLGRSGGTVTARNCLLRDGRWGWDGAVDFANGVVARCTTGASGGTARNAVFWNCATVSSGTSADHCVAFGETRPSQGGFLWGDPLFLDPDNGDFRIAANSPCVDAGDGTIAPETDFWGRPRMNTPGVKDTGVPDTNGVCPDIGLYEVDGIAKAEAGDLKALSLSVPASATVGSEMEISYVVTNVGAAAVSGTWRDSVSFVSPYGTVVAGATVQATAALESGGSAATFRRRIRVPALDEGDWTVRVDVNAWRDVYESATADGENRVESAAPLAVALAASPLGEASSGAVAAGAPFVRKFEVPAGEPYALRIEAPAGATVSYGVGAMPSAGGAQSAVTVGADGYAYVSLPAGETVYVEVSSDRGGAVTATPFAAGLAVLSATPATLPQSGEVTLSVSGLHFADGAVVTLVAGAASVAAESVAVHSAERLTATFDCAKLAAGTAYDLVVTLGGSPSPATATLPDAVRVSGTKGAPKLEASLDMPSSLRAGRAFVFYIDYANVGNADMPAPVFTVLSDQMVFTTDYGDYTNRVKLLGLGGEGSAGVLKPSESFRMAIKARVKPTAGGTISYSLKASWAGSPDAADKLPLSAFFDEQWVHWHDEDDNATIDFLVDRIGETWAAFYRRLGAHLTMLGGYGLASADYDSMREDFVRTCANAARASQSEEESKNAFDSRTSANFSDVRLSRFALAATDSKEDVDGEVELQFFDNRDKFEFFADWVIPPRQKELRERTARHHAILERDNSDSGDIWVFVGGKNDDWKTAKWYRLYRDDGTTSSYFKPGAETFILCHGNLHSVHSEWIAAMAAALKGRNGNCNVLAVDWGDSSTAERGMPLASNLPEFAFATAMSIPDVSRTAARLLDQAGVEPEYTTLIGHSHGSHVAGNIAAYLSRFGTKVKRLVGLETSNLTSHLFVAKDEKFPLSWNGSVAETTEFYKTSYAMSFGSGRDVKEVYGHYNFFVVPKTDHNGKRAYLERQSNNLTYGFDETRWYLWQMDADTDEGRLNAWRHDQVEWWFIDTINKDGDWAGLGFNWGGADSCFRFGMPEEMASEYRNHYHGVINWRTGKLELAAPSDASSREGWRYEECVLDDPERSSARPSDNFLRNLTAAVDYEARAINGYSSTWTEGKVRISIATRNNADNFSIDYDDVVKWCDLSKNENRGPWQFDDFGTGAWLCRNTDGSLPDASRSGMDLASDSSVVFKKLAWRRPSEKTFVRPGKTGDSRQLSFSVPDSFAGKDISEDGEDFLLVVGCGVADGERPCAYAGDLYPDNNFEVRNVKVKPHGVEARMTIKGIVYGDGETTIPIRVRQGETSIPVGLYSAPSEGRNLSEWRWTVDAGTPGSPNQPTTLWTVEMPEDVESMEHDVELRVSNGKKSDTARVTVRFVRVDSDDPDGDSFGGGSSFAPQSFDPNEMRGPDGVGDSRAVFPGEWMDYTIFFENRTNATAAAQFVTVEAQLSDQLDWSTFEMGDIGFGLQTDSGLWGLRNGSSEIQMDGTNLSVRTEVRIDAETGRVSWFLRVVTPDGDEDGWPYANDPTGFLPPNDLYTHCGEGHLTYRVKVREDAELGMRVNASATIVFDYNDPIVTDPAWWNTVATIYEPEVDLGDGTTTNLVLVVGQPYGELPTPKAKAGHAFGGWFTGPNGTGAKILPTTIVQTGAAELYQHWVPLNYAVVFNANGGTLPKGKKMAGQTMTYGKSVKLRKNVFARKGYVFAGWSVRKGGAVAYSDAASVKNLRTDGGTTTLYAVWAKPAYKVQFVANGGKGKMAVQSFKYGKAAKLKANGFTRKGYVFQGWATSKADAKKGKVAYKNKKSVKNLVTTGKTVKLYAVWKKK